jgi:hypothetical protein
MATTYEKIATTTLGSAATDITFSAIPATYTDLRITLTGTLVSANQPFLQFNGVTSTYSSTVLKGNGSTASSYRDTGSSRHYLGDVFVNSSSTLPSFYSVDVFSYAGSTFKTSLLTASMDYNGSGLVVRQVALFRNTAAITSILLGSGAASNFASGTSATLYGILKA